MNFFNHFLFILSGSICCQPIAAMNPEPIAITENKNNRAMLIFLDEQESDDAPDINKIGAISTAFMMAFVGQAGPIIVSASLIANTRARKEPTYANDKQKLFDRYEELMQKYKDNKCTEADFDELKDLFRFIMAFDKRTAAPWIIKKVNDALYLLIPIQYLCDLNINEAAVMAFDDKASFTQVEQQLGIKVNHMKTVTDIDEIKRPVPVPYVAQYFLDALYDPTRENPSSIFMTKKDYYACKNNNIPTWSFFIGGHGIMGVSIAYLLVHQFKNVLNFFEQELLVKLVYYLSCYGAGVNSKALYEDAEKGVDKAYPFAIITQAITDAPVAVPVMELRMQGDELQVLYFMHFHTFVKLATSTEILDYKKIADCFIHKLQMSGARSMLPQVKLPGLPWFSVIHEERVCAISATLAKTRTKPLNIETFFARKGRKVSPIGILLYAQEIPFELIVNSKTETDAPPTMISMIPGNALHHLKMVSSSVHSVEDLMLSFLHIKQLGPHKVFIIDAIKGKKGLSPSVMVHNVVIELTPQHNTVYYMQDGKLFKNIAEPAASEDENRYTKLLTLSQQAHGPLSNEVITRWNKKAESVFAPLMTSEEALQAVFKLLDEMPNGMVLHIPKIKGLICPPSQECWLQFLGTLFTYASLGSQKILWFGELELYDKSGNSMVFTKDMVIDVSEDGTTLFSTNPFAGIMMQANMKTGLGRTDEDYIPEYRILFEYFDAHRQMPTRSKQGRVSTQELLTPSAIADIEKVQKGKIMQLKEGTQQ